jgi:hypothetical protein
LRATAISIPVVVTALLMTTVLAGPAAFGATNGFVLEAFFFVESLLTFGESKLRPAILANDHLVRHGAYLLKIADIRNE